MSLAAALEPYDDDALATLVNRGLVRRARKDVDRGAVTEAEVEAERARVVVAGETVSIGADGPLGATCSCPSASTCRHVIAAVLHLRAHPDLFASPGGATQSADDLLAELLGLSLDALARWAKRRPFETATRRFRVEVSPTLEELPTSIVARFADGAEVRFLAGAGLDGALYKGPRPKRVVCTLLALFALRDRHGFTTPEARDFVLADVRGAARSRPECVREVRRLAADLVRTGISHVSRSAHDRATTLGLSCVAANLPRLGASLRGLAAELRATLEGEASADAARLFGQIAQLDALARALEASLPAGRADLVGRHRSEYVDVGALELVGLAAWSFLAPSGYRGLTLLFFAPRTGRLHTWTDARPAGVDPRFSAAGRYQDGGAVWPGGGPRELCRRAFELHDARCNDEGRLSGRDASRAVLGAATRIDEAGLGSSMIERWSEARARADALWPIGLSRPLALDDLAVLRPVAFADVRFDEIEQALLVDLIDDVGERLTLVLGYSPQNHNAVRWLASKRFSMIERPTRWVVRLARSEGPPRAAPLALWLTGEPEQPDELINLHLDPVEQTPSARWWRSWDRLRQQGVRPTRLMVAAADEAEDAPSTPWAEGTERAVASLEDEALAWAESGVRVQRDPARARDAVFQIRRRGLGDLADVAEALVSEASLSAVSPERLLELAYALRVHRQAARRAASR